MLLNEHSYKALTPKLWLIIEKTENGFEKSSTINGLLMSSIINKHNLTQIINYIESHYIFMLYILVIQQKMSILLIKLLLNLTTKLN